MVTVPPLTGRDREYKLLRSIIHDFRQGDGSLCVIRGLPGSGKTRLGDELIALGE
ncbi:MAG: AAA family ATPase, partial [Spirochaetota bacterium]